MDLKETSPYLRFARALIRSRPHFAITDRPAERARRWGLEWVRFFRNSSVLAAVCPTSDCHHNS